MHLLLDLAEQFLVLIERVRKDGTDVVQIHVHEDLELFVFAVAPIEQILVPLRDFEQQDAPLNQPKLVEGGLEVGNEFGSLVFLPESFEHLHEGTEEAGIVLGVILDVMEFVLVILRVLIQGLADAHQLR